MDPPRGVRAIDSKISERQRSSNAALGAPLLMTVPLVTFSIVMCLFSFAFYHYSVLVLCTVGSFYSLVAFFLVLNARGRISGNWYKYLATLCFFADFWGTVAGVYNYRAHMFQYWSYAERRVYTNVLPSEAAAALADAGKIIFSDSARIDTTRAVGYKAGSTYCVAPILDNAHASSVQMWAAGMDCCPMRGDFGCDDAWNPSARGAVAVVEPFSIQNGPTTRDMYKKAVNLAAGAFGMKTSSEPLLVRWVADPQSVQDNAWRSGVGFVLSATCIYMLISLVVGVVAHMMSRRGALREEAEEK